MDFTWNDEQRELRDLARTILAERSTHDRLKELEAASATVFDRQLWKTLAESGLLGINVPEGNGGAGLGLLGLLPLLEEIGRHTAAVPFVATAVGAVAPLVEFGDEQLRASWLPGLMDGSIIGTAAGVGGAGPEAAARPRVTASGTGLALSGEAAFVAYGMESDVLVVACEAPDGPALVIVAGDAPGLSRTALVTTNRQPSANLEFDSTPATLLAEGEEAVEWLAQRLRAAWCAVQAGNCDGAVRLMATYTSTREQFGKRIAEFQAVAQRAADAFIDTQMVRLTAWNALFRLSQGWEATKEVHSATFWAGDGAMRAVHAAQHLHGGIGVDTDYPVHRHFLWAKQIEHTVGTPTRELILLGNILADEPV